MSSHGCPLSAWDDQFILMASRGLRAVTVFARDLGRCDVPTLIDRFNDDLRPGPEQTFEVALLNDMEPSRCRL